MGTPYGALYSGQMLSAQLRPHKRQGKSARQFPISNQPGCRLMSDCTVHVYIRLHCTGSRYMYSDCTRMYFPAYMYGAMNLDQLLLASPTTEFRGLYSRACTDDVDQFTGPKLSNGMPRFSVTTAPY